MLSAASFRSVRHPVLPMTELDLTLVQLKKERDDHLRRIVEDCDAALAELRSRVETHYEEKHMQR